MRIGRVLANRRTFVRLAIAALGAGLMSIPALGCGFLVPPVEATRTSSLAHTAGSAVSVETENGSIMVSASPTAKDVTVVAKLKGQTQERLDATRVLAERGADNALKIYVKWPDDRRESNEGCSLEVTLPDARGATLRTSNGSITLAGASGSADLKTSNGSVTLKRHDGDVKIKTSNGAVSAEGITGAASADTSNGAITMRLSPSSAGPVELESSNGSVTVAVGQGFSGQMSVKTSNGSVTVPSGSGVVVRERTKKSATLAFGEGGKESKIKTSNGSVTVTRAD